MPPLTLAGRFRRARRLLLAAGWTLACYAGWAVGALVALPWRRAARRWNGRVIRTWTAGLVVIFGVRVRTVGEPPPRPFFMVSNHLSYVDILVLGSRLGATFISKHDIAGWPVLGHLARITGTIFVNRERRRDAVRVMGEIDRAYQEGAGIVLFPEGTSSRGDQVHPFKVALLEWAARASHPVHIVALRYATDDPAHPAEDAVNWWGDASFGSHAARLLTLRRIDATLTFGGEPIRDSDRTQLATRLHADLTARYGRSRPPSPA